MTTLITGGAGYIGAHVGLALRAAGEPVVVLDDLSAGRIEMIPGKARFVQGDVGDAELVGRVLTENKVDAIVHAAGSIVVAESVEKPLAYYGNNTVKTRTLIETALSAGVGTVLFSSTAAVYGVPESLPVAEDAPTRPINPYGRSKLASEWLIEDAARAHGLSYGILRFFNVAGADPKGRAGQVAPEATHLIKVAAEAALGLRAHVEIFGDDYDTEDGTCIRDYIHVSDLADAHVKVLRWLKGGGASRTYNCGYGRGCSVRQVLAAMRRVAGVDFDVRVGPRRPGDPPALVADPARLRSEREWRPAFDDLDRIAASALAWEKKLRGGSER